MSRRYINSSRRHTNKTSSEAAVLAISQILSKETKYRDDINVMYGHTKYLATHLMAGGEMEKALLDTNNVDDMAMKDFLNEQRERIKSIAASNARRDEHIDKFVSVMGKMRDDILKEEKEEDDNFDPQDYVSIISEKIDVVYSDKDIDETEYYNHEFCRNVRRILGEKDRSNDDDDDLEVVQPAGSQATQDANLKCPITKIIFDDPVRSKVCGHTFSRIGLEQMWRLNKYQCPVPGCSNQRIDKSQIQVDVEMQLQLRRRAGQQPKQEDELHEDIPMTIVE